MTEALPTKSPLPGVNVLLEGPTGVGKTHAIGTAVDTGLEAFYFPFEAGTESLLGYWTDRGQPVPKNLHVVDVEVAQASFSEMADAAKQVNTLTYELLKKQPDTNRSKYNQFEKFLRTFNKVVAGGVDYGPLDKWGTGRLAIIDGLTGLGDAAMKAVIGGKADRDQKDWGLAQNMVENFLRQTTGGCRCHFILISHVEREKNEITGATQITVSTLGSKLAPKIPPMFSDVILAARNGTEFFWDTANPQADLKARNVPISSKITPSFGPIIEKWKSRGGFFE